MLSEDVIDRIAREVVLGWLKLEDEFEFEHLPNEMMEKMVRDVVHKETRNENGTHTGRP